ncbi:MAG: ribose-phosphate pyrophosphokinase [Planctomycetes bacterium]|nr:ribose-phosphate pyrophosphokinase [Planctomycetota bacterium]
MRKGIKILSGSASRDLARAICNELDRPLGAALVDRFPDGEINVKIEEDIRGCDVFIVQSTCPPVNEHLMELLILMDACKRASAERVTAVLPYYGYARKDRKDEGRVPITAKLVANLICSAGANRVLCMDLHAAQIQGFFDIPVDHLYASKVFLHYFARLGTKDVVVVAPDVGSSKMASSFAKRIDADVAIVEKRRVTPDKTNALKLIGTVEGKNCIIVDDMISTAGSIAEAAKILKEYGARELWGCATHPVCCGNAFKRLEEAPFREVLVADTIPLAPGAPEKVKVLSVAPMLGEAIKRIHLGESLSIMFDRL